ncbi:MAG: hypothetical protein KDJ27_20560 [Gammaproteobacteria bacterium]|nr:hypothetical protein [Gammaproteobacteria bacterium]
MAHITIGDLEQNDELDHAAMSQILGGRPGEHLGPAFGTQLLRADASPDALIPAIYDPAWRFDGSL